MIHGDCMRVLPLLPDASVDVVLADPPYGIHCNIRLDTVRPRPRWRTHVTNDQHPFIWWLGTAARLLRSPGALLCFCRWDVQETFKEAVEASGLKLRSQVIWDRVGHGCGDCAAQFGPQHEVVWFATKGRFAFAGRRPKSVIRVPRLHSSKAAHPTQKPVPLLTELLRPLASPGAVVLDPVAGTGSAGVAALLLGHRFIGIELERVHCHTARRRLRAAYRQGP